MYTYAYIYIYTHMYTHMYVPHGSARAEFRRARIGKMSRGLGLGGTLCKGGEGDLLAKNTV